MIRIDGLLALPVRAGRASIPPADELTHRFEEGDVVVDRWDGLGIAVPSRATLPGYVRVAFAEWVASVSVDRLRFVRRGVAVRGTIVTWHNQPEHPETAALNVAALRRAGYVVVKLGEQTQDVAEEAAS